MRTVPENSVTSLRHWPPSKAFPADLQHLYIFFLNGQFWLCIYLNLEELKTEAISNTCESSSSLKEILFQCPHPTDEALWLWIPPLSVDSTYVGIAMWTPVHILEDTVFLVSDPSTNSTRHHLITNKILACPWTFIEESEHWKNWLGHRKSVRKFVDSYINLWDILKIQRY